MLKQRGLRQLLALCITTTVKLSLAQTKQIGQTLHWSGIHTLEERKNSKMERKAFQALAGLI